LEADKALIDATKNGDLAGVQAELDNGVDVNAKDDDGDTPLDVAEDHPETADFLRKHGANTGDWLNADKSIHTAVRDGNIEAVKQYLDAGTDVNAKDENGVTPLHQAAFYGQKEVVELLIAKGADVNAKEEDGWTPLHFAAESAPWQLTRGHKEVAELLIAAGADVNARDNWGRTPLHEAAYHSNKEIVGLLIAKGADVNAKDDDGTTPLDRSTEGRYGSGNRLGKLPSECN
jgi:cytohesin